MTRARAAYDDVVVAAPVTVPYVRYSIRGAHWFLAAALADLFKRAGLAKDKLDGLCVSSFTLAPDSAVGLTQHLGLTLRWLDHIPMGGACGVVALRRAARAVQSGDADIVACIAGDTNHTHSFRLNLATFSQFARDAVYPYGSGGANASFAFLTAYYMRTYGATPEDFGKICVATRQCAAISPRADEKTADPRRLSQRPADRRSAAALRLRHALRRRRGLFGAAPRRGGKTRPALRAHPRHHRTAQRLSRRSGAISRRLGARPRRALCPSPNRAEGHRRACRLR